MDERLRSFYFETRVKNAAPGELLIMLYAALVEKAENAEAELAAAPDSPERAAAPRTVSRCLDIITELSSSLRHEIDPALCSTLGGLYAFFARQFAEALTQAEPRKIGAILPLLRELKAAWSAAEKASSQAQLVAAVA